MESRKFCDHSIHHVDDRGRLTGSWTEELVVDEELGRRIRVACGICGKFYGYAQAERNERWGGDEPTQVDADNVPLPLFDLMQEKTKEGAGAIANASDLAVTEIRREGKSIDYQRLRAEVDIRKVLELLHWQATEQKGDQLRGPCPIHGSTSKRPRNFSVNLRKNMFQCFGCGKKGNQLDLYAAVTGLPLYEAACELTERTSGSTPS